MMSDFFKIIDSTLSGEDDSKILELKATLTRDYEAYIHQKKMADGIWKEADVFLPEGSEEHSNLLDITSRIDSSLAELESALNHFERQHQRRLIKLLRQEINSEFPIAPSFRREHVINKVINAGDKESIEYVLESLIGSYNALKIDYDSVDNQLIGMPSNDREHFEAILDNADDVMDALTNDIRYLKHYLETNFN